MLARGSCLDVPIFVDHDESPGVFKDQSVGDRPNMIRQQLGRRDHFDKGRVFLGIFFSCLCWWSKVLHGDLRLRLHQEEERLGTESDIGCNEDSGHNGCSGMANSCSYSGS